MYEGSLQTSRSLSMSYARLCAVATRSCASKMRIAQFWEKRPIQEGTSERGSCRKLAPADGIWRPFCWRHSRRSCFDLLSWPAPTGRTGLKRRMDRKSHAAWTVPSVLYRCGPCRSVLCWATHLSTSANMRTRGSMRSASNSPDLQARLRDSFSARSDCARISVCSQVLLLSLDE